MAATRAPSLFWRVTSWVGTHLLAVATIAGFTVYGLLRVSYATFYGRFDVEPEEVGLGQTEILTQSGLVLFVSVLITGGVLGVALLAYRAMGIRPAILEPNASLWRRALAFSSGPYWIVVIPTVLIMAFVVLFELPVRARTLADQVEIRATFRDEGVAAARQLAYPSEVTFPGEDLIVGAVVPGFADAWTQIVATWRSHEWNRQVMLTASTSRRTSWRGATSSSLTTDRCS